MTFCAGLQSADVAGAVYIQNSTRHGWRGLQRTKCDHLSHFFRHGHAAERNVRQQLVADLMAEEAAPEGETLERQRRSLDRCLTKLDDTQRELLLLSYQPGARLHEVAARAGRSVQGHYKSVQRLRARLLACIDDRLPTFRQALLALPAEGLTLADKQQINKALLKSGATIGEMNCVRKHLSAIKGGRLAKACWPATVYTYAISDVPGDLATVIASGPTVADPSTSADALAILKRYNIEAPQAVIDWLNNPASETVKADDPALARSHFQLIAKPQQSLEAAAVKARQAGFSPLILGDLEGESREVAKVHAGIARQIVLHGQPLKAPCVILSGGETTVTVRPQPEGTPRGRGRLPRPARRTPLMP